MKFQEIKVFITILNPLNAYQNYQKSRVIENEEEETFTRYQQ